MYKHIEKRKIQVIKSQDKGVMYFVSIPIRFIRHLKWRKGSLLKIELKGKKLEVRK